MLSTLMSIDPGTSLGWKVGNDRVSASGVLDLKPSRYEGGGMRFLRLRRWLDEQYRLLPFTELVYEEVHAHKGTAAAHIYGGIVATIQSWCEDVTARGGSVGAPAPQIAYRGVGVGTIKRFATGKGNAGKPQMIAAVQERW